MCSLRGARFTSRPSSRLNQQAASALREGVYPAEALDDSVSRVYAHADVFHHDARALRLQFVGRYHGRAAVELPRGYHCWLYLFQPPGDRNFLLDEALKQQA